VPGAATATVEVRDLRRDEFPVAVAVLARGMRDNPLHVAAFGTNRERRRRRLEGQFAALFELMTEQTPICAVQSGTIVGVTGIAPPGTCRPSRTQRLRFAPALLRAGPRAVGQVGRWLAAWGKRDPDEPHSHLGPLGVDAHVQRRGIGSRIMAEYTRHLDDAGVVGYLETDKAANVPFYERHGFVVVGEEPVIGVPNWYMRREAQ
jgi:ribosomal protein S18 acetylase RimI-like enzyme